MASTSPLDLTSMLSSILNLVLYLATKSVMGCSCPLEDRVEYTPPDITAASNADLPSEPKARSVSVRASGVSFTATFNAPLGHDSSSLT